jgi:hypothetical protein
VTVSFFVFAVVLICARIWASWEDGRSKHRLTHADKRSAVYVVRISSLFSSSQTLHFFHLFASPVPALAPFTSDSVKERERVALVCSALLCSVFQMQHSAGQSIVVS